MKVLGKITYALAKLAEAIIMAMVIGLVALIVSELCRRNFLNQSWLPTTEMCGIFFLWMAFIGLIPLYQNNGLMRLDFLVSRMQGVVAEIVWYVTAIVGGLMGVVMIVAFCTQYPFFSSRAYATMPHVHYTVQYLPMMLAGVFMALKSVENILRHVMKLDVQNKEVGA